MESMILKKLPKICKREGNKDILFLKQIPIFISMWHQRRVE